MLSFHDTRVLPGKHERIEGIEQLSDIINIDQTPIGRTPRSNPATYIGFYDDIRRLFAATPEAQASRLHRRPLLASTSRVGAAKSAPAKG